MSDNKTHYVLEIGGVRYETPVAEIDAIYSAIRSAPGGTPDTQLLDAFGGSDVVTAGAAVDKEPTGPLPASGSSVPEDDAP